MPPYLKHSEEQNFECVSSLLKAAAKSGKSKKNEVVKNSSEDSLTEDKNRSQDIPHERSDNPDSSDDEEDNRPKTPKLSKCFTLVNEYNFKIVSSLFVNTEEH